MWVGLAGGSSRLGRHSWSRGVHGVLLVAFVLRRVWL